MNYLKESATEEVSSHKSHKQLQTQRQAHTHAVDDSGSYGDEVKVVLELFATAHFSALKIKGIVSSN